MSRNPIVYIVVFLALLFLSACGDLLTDGLEGGDAEVESLEADVPEGDLPDGDDADGDSPDGDAGDGDVETPQVMNTPTFSGFTASGGTASSDDHRLLFRIAPAAITMKAANSDYRMNATITPKSN